MQTIRDEIARDNNEFGPAMSRIVDYAIKQFGPSAIDLDFEARSIIAPTGENLPSLRDLIAVMPCVAHSRRDEQACNTLIDWMMRYIARSLQRTVDYEGTTGTLCAFVRSIRRQYQNSVERMLADGNDINELGKAVRSDAKKVDIVYRPINDGDSGHFVHIELSVLGTRGYINVYDSSVGISDDSPYYADELTTVCQLYSQLPRLGWEDVEWTTPRFDKTAMQKGPEDCGFFALASFRGRSMDRRIFDDLPALEGRAKDEYEVMTGLEDRLLVMNAICETLFSDYQDGVDRTFPKIMAVRLPIMPFTPAPTASSGTDSEKRPLSSRSAMIQSPEKRTKSTPATGFELTDPEKFVNVEYPIRVHIIDAIMNRVGHDGKVLLSDLFDYLDSPNEDSSFVGTAQYFGDDVSQETARGVILRILQGDHKVDDQTHKTFICTEEEDGQYWSVSPGFIRSLDSKTCDALFADTPSYKDAMVHDAEWVPDIKVVVVRISGDIPGFDVARKLMARSADIANAHHDQVPSSGSAPLLVSTVEEASSAIAEGKRVYIEYLREPGTSNRQLFDKKDGRIKLPVGDLLEKVIALYRRPKVLFVGVGWDSLTTNNRTWILLRKQFETADMRVDIGVAHSAMPSPSYSLMTASLYWTRCDVAYLASLFQATDDDGITPHICGFLESAECSDCEEHGFFLAPQNKKYSLGRDRDGEQYSVRQFFAHSMFLAIVEFGHHHKIDFTFGHDRQEVRNADTWATQLFRSFQRNTYKLTERRRNQQSSGICKHCGTTFLATFPDHLQQCTADKPMPPGDYLCICGIRFSSANALRSHTKICDAAIQELTCDHCGLKLSSQYKKTNHMGYMCSKNPSNPACSVCGKQQSLAKLTRHEQSCRAAAARRCSHCGWGNFSSDYNLNRHVKACAAKNADVVAEE